MTNSVIHLKFEYSEAIEDRKAILSSQINLIKLKSIIKEYSEIRKKELDKKLELQKKMRQMNSNFTQIKKSFPILKIPKKLRKEETLEKKEKIEAKIPKIFASPLEKELQIIKEQLAELEAKS